MKAFAARPRDAEDIRQLTQLLGLHTADDVLASISEIFPDEEPPARLRLLLEDIFSDQGNLSTPALPQSLKARPRQQCPEPPQRPLLRQMRIDDLVLTPMQESVYLGRVASSAHLRSPRASTTFAPTSGSTSR